MHRTENTTTANRTAALLRLNREVAARAIRSHYGYAIGGAGLDVDRNGRVFYGSDYVGQVDHGGIVDLDREPATRRRVELDELIGCNHVVRETELRAYAGWVARQHVDGAFTVKGPQGAMAFVDTFAEAVQFARSGGTVHPSAA